MQAVCWIWLSVIWQSKGGKGRNIVVGQFDEAAPLVGDALLNQGQLCDVERDTISPLLLRAIFVER